MYSTQNEWANYGLLTVIGSVCHLTERWIFSETLQEISLPNTGNLLHPSHFTLRASRGCPTSMFLWLWFMLCSVILPPSLSEECKYLFCIYPGLQTWPIIEYEGCNSTIEGSVAICKLWFYVLWLRLCRAAFFLLTSPSPCLWLNYSSVSNWSLVLLYFFSAERKTRAIIVNTHQATGAWTRDSNDKSSYTAHVQSFC